ncbi:uncharacterized protein LOC107740733 [Sinocyclocheilus rhinocerous]|uniref:uncharacterized protein LOC107740733 n=1 Tax=Sinocyclocheilus rhinocerous TaxID=307959 RepID=UPI0007BAA3EE|nr:PREDICTED: uncharacterized protein LOC107740733 [Sinocyclocheilus rhinocerous]
MIYAFALFTMSLWCLVDVTDEVKTISVMEGDSFTLHTEVNEIQKYLLIQWMFGSTRIAEINRLTQTNSTYDADGRFRDRLKLEQTGSLTITNTSTTDSGLYQLATVSRETSYINFNVTVCGESSSSNYVLSCSAVNNSIVNHTEDANITELYQPSSEELKRISVMMGDSVTLNTDVSEVQTYLLMQWMFGSTRIAEFNRLTQTISIYDGPDGRFRDRLQLDQTGSLIITNTRTTDSGLYHLTVVGEETKYKSFNVTVYQYPWSTSSPESLSSSNCVTSSFVVNNSTVNQTENNNNTEHHQPSSDNIHCCGFNEAVIRLALSALVGVATVAVLVYDIRSTRHELIRTEETKHYHHTLRPTV